MPIAYISFHAPINPVTTQQLLAASIGVIQKGADHIYYLFSTPGGVVQDGIRLFNSIKSFPIETTMHNMGNIDSIGNAIFLAGKTRIACPTSTFMFHGVGFDVQNARLERKVLEERLDTLNADEKKIGGIIASETQLSGEVLKDLFRQAITKDADDALKFGIIHKIGFPQIDPAAIHIQLVFS